MTKIILITGASTGFGRDTAETLSRDGYRMFAGMRDIAGRNRAHAEALRAQNIDVVELDVTEDGSVDRAIAAVLKAAGRIDVLINNAGIASAGVSEAFTPDQAKVLFNTNVVGVLRYLWRVKIRGRSPDRQFSLRTVAARRRCGAGAAQCLPDQYVCEHPAAGRSGPRRRLRRQRRNPWQDVCDLHRDVLLRRGAEPARCRGHGRRPDRPAQG